MRRGTQILALALVLGMLLGLLPGASAREVGDAPRGGGGGWLQWNCEFQSPTNLLGWRIIDANGDGCTFGPYLTEDDTFCLRSDRNQAEPGTEPQASDDYLISPRIQLPAGQEYTLGLELGGILNGGYNVDCEIYVYTGAETIRPENLYSLLDRPYRNHYVFWSRWETFTMDLSAYAGQTVQLVLRHRNPDRSVLMVNRVFVSGQEPWTELSKVTAFHVPEPRLGVTPEALTEGDITFPDYAAYELVPGSLRYFKIISEQTVEMHNEEFTAEGEYNLSFRVRPKAGASFTAEGIASVNGRFAQYVFREDRGEAEVYLFNIPSLAPDRELKEVNLLTEPPVVGASPAGTPERWLENGAWNFNYSLASAVWSPGVTGTFAPRVAYSLEAVIRPENGFYVTDHTHFTLNGAPFSFHSDLPGQEGAHYLRADFPADQGALLRRAELILTQPQGGQLPEDARIVDRRYRLVSQSWFPLSQWGEVQEPLGEEETLEDGRTYRCVFLLRPEAGQAFNEGTRVFVNGEEATLYGRNQDGDWVYCLDVKAQQPSPIYMIDLDVPVPRAGEEFYAGADSAGARVRESNPRVYITADNWYNEGGISGTPLPFEAGKTYIVEVELRERLGWVITEDTLIRINGEAVPWKQKLNVSTWGVASRGYTMEAPVPVKEADFRVTAPWAGTNYNWEADSTGAWCVDVPGRIIFDKWYTQEGAGGGHMTFEEGQGYVLELLFQPDAPYQFAQDAVIRINGEPAAQVTREDAHTWRIRSRPFIAGAPRRFRIWTSPSTTSPPLGKPLTRTRARWWRPPPWPPSFGAGASGRPRRGRRCTL